MKNKLLQVKEILFNKFNDIKENKYFKKILNNKYTSLFFIAILICFICSNLVLGNKKSNLETFDIQGEITFIQDYDINPCMFVENYEDTKAKYTKAYINITDKTIIQNQGSRKKLSVKELKKGHYIKVVFDNDIMETYPVQANAKIIEIVKK